MPAPSQPTLPRPWRDWLGISLALALLVARKPWAFSTPQLYAEDGSIFLLQDDQWGARAFLAPYMGYLHFLPRLVAWTARVAADVAHWPAIYNGAALLVTAGVLSRFASPRLDLPHKPWLALAFALVPQTGEVLFNVTNIQWVASFFLLQQVFLARPVTTAQRVADLLLALVVGLTGPFSAIFLPLFAWRWWRDRGADHLALLLVVAACAAVQVGFVAHAGAAGLFDSSPFRPLMFFAVLGSRLAVWPFLGPAVARGLPLLALALAGCGFLAVLAGWALRPHPRRALRAQVLAALALVTLACVCRLRPDTWETANLDNGDRYFFIPRVLVAWLVIWEFDSARRALAWTARALAGAVLVLELPHHRLPAPPDYRWAEHCAPLRRGEPATISTLPEGWRIEYPGRPPKP